MLFEITKSENKTKKKKKERKKKREREQDGGKTFAGCTNASRP